MHGVPRRGPNHLTISRAIISSTTEKAQVSMTPHMRRFSAFPLAEIHEMVCNALNTGRHRIRTQPHMAKIIIQYQARGWPCRAPNRSRSREFMKMVDLNYKALSHCIPCYTGIEERSTHGIIPQKIACHLGSLIAHRVRSGPGFF